MDPTGVTCESCKVSKTNTSTCTTEEELKKELKRIVGSDPYAFKSYVKKCLKFSCVNETNTLINFMQESMLSIAAAKNPILFLMLIQKEKFDIETLNSYGETPLHYVVRTNPSSIPLLIHNGADTEAMNKQGERPLHVAIKKNPASIELLLSNGATPDSKTRCGKSVQDYLDKYANKPLRKKFKPGER